VRKDVRPDHDPRAVEREELDAYAAGVVAEEMTCPALPYAFPACAGMDLSKTMSNAHSRPKALMRERALAEFIANPTIRYSFGKSNSCSGFDFKTQ